MKNSKLLICSILFSLNAHALKLDEAMLSAYENNPQLKSEQENFKSSIQNIPMALSQGFLPDIRFKNQTTDSKGKNALRDATSPSSSTESNQRSVTLTQNLFAGGAGVFGLASAKHGADVALFQYTLKEQEFFTRAIETYVDLIVSREKVEASKSFVNSSSKEYYATLEKLKVGESTKTDVAQTKAQMMQAKAQLANEKAAMHTNESAFRSFFFQEPENLEFPEIPLNLPTNFEEFKSQALMSSLELKANKSNLSALKNRTLAQSGSLLPQVNASISAGQSKSEGPAQLSPPGITKQKSYSTTLAVNVPILSQGGAEHSKIRQAKATQRKAVYDLENAKRSIETRIIQSWEAYEAAKESLEFTIEAVEASKLAYNGQKARYDVGLVTIVDLLKAEKNLYDNISQKISAKQNLIKTSFRIKSDLAQLTSKHMSFISKPFDPSYELRKTKFKVIGF